MSDAIFREPDYLDILAAEYLLGVLDKSDRRRAAILVEHDADFARQVDAWNRRLAPGLGHDTGFV